MSGETKTFDELYADFNEQGETKYKLQKITVNDINLGILDSLLEIPRTLQFVDDNKSFSYKVKENADGLVTVYKKNGEFQFDEITTLPATTPFTIVLPPAVTGGKKRRRKTAKNARKTNKRMKKRKSNRRR